MKPFYVRALVLGILLLASLPRPGFAAESFPVSSDLWVDGASNTILTNPLFVVGSDIGAGCNQHNGTAYLQWKDLDKISQAIGSANIVLTAGADSNIPSSATMALYATVDDNMPPSGLGAILSSITISSKLTPGTEVNFPTSTSLITYLEGARTGDGVATFAVRWSTCSSHLQTFTDNSTRTPASLYLFDPNLVGAVTFAASASRWPFYLGLVALSLIAAAGVAWSRRRATQR